MEGRRTVSVPRADWPGVYVIHPGSPGTAGSLPASSGVSVPATAARSRNPRSDLKLAVNIDTKESDVSCLRGAALEAALKDVPLRIVEGDLNAVTQAIQQLRVGVPLWRPLLLVALLVFLVEFALAHRLSRLKLAKLRLGAARISSLPEDAAQAPSLPARLLAWVRRRPGKTPARKSADGGEED